MHRRSRRCSETSNAQLAQTCCDLGCPREGLFAATRCHLVGLHPKTHRYVTKRSGDEELRQRLRELALQRRRFGYRRLGLMLKRQGIKLSPKELYRLYKEERLTARKRGVRTRALRTRAPMAIPQDRNLRWSLDFVADTLVSGRRFRILTLVDDFTRECLGLVVDTSLTGPRVARELDRIAELRGYPGMIVSDNGTELTSNAILTWQQRRGVEWHYIAPGKPMQNGPPSPRANRCRMASSRASTAGCATSASTSTCSPASKRRARSSKNGEPTTTPTDRTRASTGSHQPSSQHAPRRGKTGTDSPYERGQIGEQVNATRSGERIVRTSASCWALRRLPPRDFHAWHGRQTQTTRRG